jgi:hypothetical protein
MYELLYDHGYKCIDNEIVNLVIYIKKITCVLPWIRSILRPGMARIAAPSPIPSRITAYPTSSNQSSGSGTHIGATGISPLPLGPRSAEQRAPLLPTRFHASTPLSAIGIKSFKHKSLASNLTGQVTGGLPLAPTLPTSPRALRESNLPLMQPWLCGSPANTSTLRIP